MSNLTDHEAEQAAITAAYDAEEPTVTNWFRAERGLTALNAWKAAASEGGDSFDPATIADLLADMMHLCRLNRDVDGNPISFDECLETARINFDAEANEEPDE